MKQGERCLVVHGGVEVEGVVKSYHQDLDQVLVAVHKASGGYFEMLRATQDVRLIRSRAGSEELVPADASDAEEEKEKVGVGTPMDLDSEERATAVFLASLSSAADAASSPPAGPDIRVGSWKSPTSFSSWETSVPSRSAPASALVGSLPTSLSSDLLFSSSGRQQQQQQHQQHQQTPASSLPLHQQSLPTQIRAQQTSRPQPASQAHFHADGRQVGEDVETITRIMEISLNASSPPAGPHTTYRPIVYLATSPPTSQFEEGDGTTQGLILTTARPSVAGHSVSRPINIPVRRHSREVPLGGLHGSPKRAHIAHLVLSEPSVALPASLSSSSSSAALGSVPTQLGSFSPPTGGGLMLSGVTGGSSAPLTGRRVRSDVKKCRKVYGIEHRDQWCNQCRWKKACTRFPDPTSPPKHP